MLSQYPSRRVFELPVEATADVAPEESFLFQFMECLAGSVLRNVDFVRCFAHRHRDLAIVEAVVALRQRNVERTAYWGHCLPRGGLEKPMVKLDEARLADAPACLINSAAIAPRSSLL